jgi:nicotinate phosphoribosyltransferase
MASRTVSGITIECVEGDIVTQPDMDAIVNAANAQLRRGGGVAGAIHRAAGSALEAECAPFAPIEPGQAVITRGHALPNRYVIHCLGPVFGRDEPAADLLASCYRNALQCGEAERIRSIAFPAISTGAFGYPKEQAARVALQTIIAMAPHLQSVRHIRVVLDSAADRDIHARLLDELLRIRDSGITPRPELAYGGDLALFTDLYELTMLQAYFEEAMDEPAVFTLFVRRLPARRNFLLACGLDTVLAQLEGLRFGCADLDYLASCGKFSDAFLRWLAEFRFTGDVYAMAEGTPMFANEPLLEVVAPLPQAQLVETLVMNQINLQTVVASKAVRMVAAADGRPVVDFGARRMHGIDAALKAARAFHVAGVAGTSNVLAGRLYGLPLRGTMAHSYIQAHDDEAAAFAAFTRRYPDTVLLVDTYDTLTGIARVIELAQRRGDDFNVRSIRLDSGDLAALAREGRAMLDAAGLQQVEIFASGGLDEHEIQRLLAAGAPIDGFGVGTSMGVSNDAPDLDLAYKLAAYAGRGRLKLSSGKPILPGRKQVFRSERNGVFTGDVITRWGEDLPGQPLLAKVMEHGRRMAGHVTELETMRAHAHEQLARLPAAIRALDPADPPYAVTVSAALHEYQESVMAAVSGH